MISGSVAIANMAAKQAPTVDIASHILADERHGATRDETYRMDGNGVVIGGPEGFTVQKSVHAHRPKPAGIYDRHVEQRSWRF
jgi:hypothetical protein